MRGLPKKGSPNGCGGGRRKARGAGDEGVACAPHHTGERLTTRCLPLLRRRAILGHRGLHERLERARVDRLPIVDVDRPARVAFQAGIEEARWVGDAGPPGERELHDLRVRLSGAHDPVVRPDRNPTIAFDGFFHFRSSIIPGSASRMSARMRASVSSRHPPGSRFRWSLSREAGVGLVADLRGLRARDVPVAFGFAISVSSLGL